MSVNASDRVVLQHEEFRGHRWDFGSKRSRVQFVVIGSSFFDCSFANFTDVGALFASGFERSRYHGCEFRNVHFLRVPGLSFELVECSFIDCTFGEFFSGSADIVDCTFKSKIKKGFFSARSTRTGLPQISIENGFISTRPSTEAPSRLNVIRGNDFSHAELFDFDFRGGVSLADQLLPVGPDYVTLLHAADAVVALYNEVVGWADSNRRKRLLPWLQGLKMHVDAGQRDFFFSMHGYSRQDREETEDIIGLLRGMIQQSNG